MTAQENDMTAPDENPGATSDAVGLPTFEESLAELQQIAHELEEGTLGLDESLRRFERGIALLRQCYRTLEQAELRIEILTGFDAAGIAVTAPFDASATVDPSVAPAAGKRKRARTRKELPLEATDKSPEAADNSSPRAEDTPVSEKDDPHTRLF